MAMHFQNFAIKRRKKTVMPSYTIEVTQHHLVDVFTLLYVHFLSSHSVNQVGTEEVES